MSLIKIRNNIDTNSMLRIANILYTQWYFQLIVLYSQLIIQYAVLIMSNIKINYFIAIIS